MTAAGPPRENGWRVSFKHAQGNAITIVFLHIYDGQSHPSTGSPIFDATAYTRVDNNTIIFSRSKAGKLLQIGSGVISQDARTYTVTTTGTVGANGITGTNIVVYEKQ